MSGLAGWMGPTSSGRDVLLRMAEAMACGSQTGGPPEVVPWAEPPGVEVQTCLRPEFALAATQPTSAGDVARIASSPDGCITAAFAGYLYTEEDDPRVRPAAHCLRLYQQFGLGFAERLNGSFAVAICDTESSQVHLVTQRLASRPLYYCTHGPFLFATEVKAILSFPGVSREVSTDAMLQFMARQRVMPRTTYYPHVRRAPEASVTTWDGCRVRCARYWQPPAQPDVCPDPQENARRAYRVIRGAVRRACAGTERPMLMLSGGLDSRCIASASEAGLLCVTMHAHPCREVRIARRIADALGHEHRFVRLPPSYPLGLVTEGALISDGMHGFCHAQGLYLADTVASEGADAVLNGLVLEAWLSDRHLPRWEWRMAGRRCRLPVLRARKRLDIRRELSRGWLSPDLPLLRELAGEDRMEAAILEAQDQVDGWVSGLGDTPADPYLYCALARLSHISAQRAYLNVLAIERLAPGRAISCDSEVIDLFLTIPPEQRLGHGLYRSMFSIADRRCRWIPYSNTGVPLLWPALLEYLCTGIRGGFDRALYALVDGVCRSHAWRVDRAAWPRVSVPLRDRPEWHRYLRRRADESHLVAMGLFSADALRRAVEEQITGRGGHWTLLSNWITLEEWLAHYGP